MVTTPLLNGTNDEQGWLGWNCFNRKYVWSLGIRKYHSKEMLLVAELGLGVISRLENRTWATSMLSFQEKWKKSGTREIKKLFMCGTEAFNFGVKTYLIFWCSSSTIVAGCCRWFREANKWGSITPYRKYMEIPSFGVWTRDSMGFEPAIAACSHQMFVPCERSKFHPRWLVSANSTAYHYRYGFPLKTYIRRGQFNPQTPSSRNMVKLPVLRCHEMSRFGCSPRWCSVSSCVWRMPSSRVALLPHWRLGLGWSTKTHFFFQFLEGLAVWPSYISALIWGWNRTLKKGCLPLSTCRYIRPCGVVGWRLQLALFVMFQPPFPSKSTIHMPCQKRQANPKVTLL